MVLSPLGLIMDTRFIIIVALLIYGIISPGKVHADVYVDIGFTYIDEIDVTTSGRLEIFGQTVEAEYTTSLEVKEWVPMLRVGFIHNGWAIEYDTIGAPSLYIPRINLFYRVQFK